MTLPLLILAVPAIFAGFVNIDKDIEHLLVGALPEGIEVEERVFRMGIAIARRPCRWPASPSPGLIYQREDRLVGVRCAAASGRVHTLLENKYYFDVLYERVIVEYVFYAGHRRSARRRFDRVVVDGAVNGVGKARAAARLRAPVRSRPGSSRPTARLALPGCSFTVVAGSRAEPAVGDAVAVSPRLPARRSAPSPAAPAAGAGGQRARRWPPLVTVVEPGAGAGACSSAFDRNDEATAVRRAHDLDRRRGRRLRRAVLPRRRRPQRDDGAADRLPLRRRVARLVAASTLRPREYFAWMLALETAVMGVFLAQDLILFFLFWELELIPMFLLISIWGTGRREYSAMKFVLYTLAGWR